MAVLYHPGSTPRASTTAPTRARFELLARRGAGDGLAEPPADARRSRPGRARLIDGAGAVGLLVIALHVLAHQPVLARSSTDGGFVLLSIATVLVVAAARPPGQPARPDPARLPAAALDRRALLRHLPLALPDHRPHLARAARTAPTCCAALLQVAATFGIAALSWQLRRGPDPPRRPGPALERCARRAGAPSGLAARLGGCWRAAAVPLVALVGAGGRRRSITTPTGGGPGNAVASPRPSTRSNEAGRRSGDPTGTAPATRSSTSATRPPRGSSRRTTCRTRGQRISAVRPGRRRHPALRDLRRALDLRDLRRASRTPRRRPGLEGRRLPTAAGSSPSARTKPPRLRRLRASATTNGSNG